METVGSAFHGGAELAAGGMSEVGIKLVPNERKVLDRFGRNRDQGSCHSLIVVIHALDHEVVVARALSSDRRTRPKPHCICIGNARIQHGEVQNTRAGAAS